ncbi:hypothetical protein [Microvirga rosea]|nr:hypothetical protein [Microvirga rosea]MCB8823131.1 hypothetical protein [Microvirga rosea]
MGIIEKGSDAPREPTHRFRRLGWFALIYFVSLVAFTAVVYGLRGLIPH